MDEIATDVSKQNSKSISISTKRAALSVIDVNINLPKSNNLLNKDVKSGNQQKFCNNVCILNGYKFQIFEDKKETNAEITVPSCSKETHFKCASVKEHKEFSNKTKKDTSLMCMRNNSYIDLVWCTPYIQDIFLYFKSIEQQFQPNPNYMEKQLDITMQMRSVLVDWLVEVGEEYKLHTETLYLAVSYTDRFLSHMSVLKEKLQLVGTASMFIAAKYEEIYPPELKDYVYITDDTYTKKQILRMEHLILKVLNFDLSVPTAYSFLQLYCSINHAPSPVINLSKFICELSLLDGNSFLNFLPSIVAAGSLALANYTLGFDMWDNILEESTGYQLTELTYVITCLYDKYSSVPTHPQRAVYEKYKSAKFEYATMIQPPKNLVFPQK